MVDSLPGEWTGRCVLTAHSNSSHEPPSSSFQWNTNGANNRHTSLRLRRCYRGTSSSQSCGIVTLCFMKLTKDQICTGMTHDEWYEGLYNTYFILALSYTFSSHIGYICSHSHTHNSHSHTLILTFFFTFWIVVWMSFRWCYSLMDSIFYMDMLCFYGYLKPLCSCFIYLY